MEEGSLYVCVCVWKLRVAGSELLLVAAPYAGCGEILMAVVVASVVTHAGISGTLMGQPRGPHQSTTPSMDQPCMYTPHTFPLTHSLSLAVGAPSLSVAVRTTFLLCPDQYLLGAGDYTKVNIECTGSKA